MSDNLPRGTSPPNDGVAATLAATVAASHTVDDAAAILGCSKRSLERHARTWGIAKYPRPQAGSPPITVYDPDDVARVASERRQGPAPHVLPVGAAGNGNGHGSLIETRARGAFSRREADDPVTQVFALFLRALQSPPSPPVAETVAESANPFLTLAEAAAYRHVSERLVLRWMRTGKLDFEREPRSQWTAADRGWRIRLKDLEAL
jgi:hypothetical protein